ncbi:MAG: ribulose-phosphate 3-epimerase [Thermoplasmata archaeon]|nr:ribulose-phosphate 3-epimerase [Thermoplasmata archaeon]
MSPRKIMIAPSLLSARFTHLEEDVVRVEKGGADMLHLDIMDGHFVPNISFGPAVVKQLRPCTTMPFDAHLMISHPIDYIEKFADAGSDWITVHAECDDDIAKSISMIKELGIKPGLSLNPGTPFTEAIQHMEDIDMLLLMTVNPGFSGQKFMTEVMDKLSEAKKHIDANSLDIDIQVDGGIGPANANIVAQNGGNILVAGNAAFGGDGNITANIAAIRESALKGIQ